MAASRAGYATFDALGTEPVGRVAVIKGKRLFVDLQERPFALDQRTATVARRVRRGRADHGQTVVT